jgi:hypothetical protein
MWSTGRLESGHTLTGIGGSNPSLSASQSGLQRKSAFSSREIRERCPFFADLAYKRDCREWAEVAVLTSNSSFFSGRALGSPTSQGLGPTPPVEKWLPRLTRYIFSTWGPGAPPRSSEGCVIHPVSVTDVTRTFAYSNPFNSSRIVSSNVCASTCKFLRQISFDPLSTYDK